MEKVRLLILVKSIDGGTGTFVLNLLDIRKLFRNDQFEIKTLALEKPSFRKIKSDNFVYFADEKFYPEKYTLSPKYFVSFFKEIFWLKRAVDSFKPDIILTIDSHCILLTEIFKFSLRKKVKTLATVHNNLRDILRIKSAPYLYNPLKRLLIFFLNNTDSLICVSQHLSEDLADFFKLRKRPLTIYSGLPDKYTKNYPRTKKPKDIIVSVSRLAAQKDHKTLIEAFYILLKELPAARLWLVGDGPLKTELQKKVKQLGIAPKVRFWGWFQNPQKILKKADVFVLSSKREGFGLVLIEAMSQGLPVVSTDSPFGPSEILGSGNYGILVPVGDIQAIKNSLLKLLTDDKFYQKYAKKSYKRAEYFSKEKMLSNYKKLILQILERP